MPASSAKCCARGEPRRVSQQDKIDPVNRRVDAQLKYQTRTLLAVPLRSANGEMLGVFEVINKRDGDFSSDDEAALVELAAHAAVALENTQDRETSVRFAPADGRSSGRTRAADRQQPRHRGAALDGAARRRYRSGRAGAGRKWHGQGSGQPVDSLSQPAPRSAVRGRQLRRHRRNTFGKRIVRPRERCIHRRPRIARGKFELAAGGTLLLDEIGDLSPGGQAKLLRVLEEKIVVRVGGSRPIPVDVRVIAATNQNLADLVRAKKFRQDLYFRLNVVVLELPPLADRGDDILLLAEHFLADFCPPGAPQAAEVFRRGQKATACNTPGPATCASCEI